MSRRAFFRASAMESSADKEVSLYIHVPFCRSKCAYCSFYSFVPKAGQIERWLSCVGKELLYVKEKFACGRPFVTIYVGGGTPSIMDIGQWKTFFAALGALPKTADCEFTIEANPESIEAEKLSLWKDNGVNRVSIGVQSLDDAELRLCGRRHSAEQALRALETAQDFGFRVSADLIFGLPYQTLRGWHGNMSRLVRLGIEHISLYQLMIEPDSFWGRHTPADLPDGYPMYRWAQYYLPKKGLAQYEIASFAAKGEESRHNMAYWIRSDVCAAGPAAWGFVGGKRFANAKNFDTWAQRVERGESAVDYEEELTGAARASEAAVLALRTSEGIDFEDFARNYGAIWLEKILERIDAMPQRYFLRKSGRIALSPSGMRVGNAIWSELIGLEKEAGS